MNHPAFNRLTRMSMVTVLTMLFFSLASQSQTFSWAKRFGGSGASVNAPAWDRSLAIDASGNLISISSFSGIVDFDPGTGVYNLNAINGGASVQKLNSTGNFLWATQLKVGILSVAVDEVGNVLLSGTFSGTQDFDPSSGSYNLTSFGSYDVFILKLDANGAFVWAKQVGGVSQETNGSIHVASSGTIYISGAFSATADFDPDPVITYNLASAGSEDGFLLAIDGNGNFVSVFHKSSPAGDNIGYVTTDESQNIYYNGRYNGTYMVEKQDASQTIAWTVQLPLIDVYAIIVDANQNVITCGNFWGTFDFDHGPGQFTMSSPNHQSMFNMKYDANGNFMWASTVKTNSHANSIATDNYGNVYTAGCFHLNGSVDFDPGPGTFNLRNNGSGAMFIQKLSPSGGFIWAGQVGGESRTNTYGRGIVLTPAGEIFTLFSFSGTIDIDPGPAKITLKSLGTDMMIHKMLQQPPPVTLYEQNNEEQVLTGVSVYPNPTTGYFTLSLPVSQLTFKVELRDAAGRLVWRASNTNDQKLVINLAGKSKGLYYLDVSSKSLNWRRIIIYQ